MRRVLAAAVLLFAVSAALGHGASKGLHLHLTPDPAPPGAKVSVEIDAEAPMTIVEIGFVGAKSVTRELEKPTRVLTVEVTVPEKVEGETINCHAEVLTTEGKTLRASAVLVIERRDQVLDRRGSGTFLIEIGP